MVLRNATDAFTRLIMQVVEGARRNALVSESLYREILAQASTAWGQSEPETIALALRSLEAFCNWPEFGWAMERLGDGIRVEDVHLERQRVEEEWQAKLCQPEYEGYRTKRDQLRAESEEAETKADRLSVEVWESERRFFKKARHIETLMGFDRDVMNELIATLGPWDSSAVPESALDLLPEELTFPLSESFRRTPRATPYDHRLHVLVRELVSRLGEEGRADPVVIMHCGHVLSDLLHADDEEAAADLVLDQLTLLAEEYVERHPSDIVALCWRGELALWSRNHDLALEIAQRVWTVAADATAWAVNRVISFFALIRQTAQHWGRPNWDQAHFPWYVQLGEIKARWIDRDQPLAWAIVQNAFQRGTWNTSLLCSMLVLRDSGYWPSKPNNVPVECWAWLAEQAEGTSNDDELYYMCWSDAFAGLGQATSPALAHNVIVATLAGLLFRRNNGEIEASIQSVLEAFEKLHRDHSMLEKERLALELMSSVYSEIRPERLTAGDRLAIVTSLGRLRSVKESSAATPPLLPNALDSPRDRIDPALLKQSESYVRGTLLSETVWAKLTTTGRHNFAIGEFHYIIGSKLEVEVEHFNIFAHCYSNGLLGEIQESIRGPLAKDRSLEVQFRDQFGGKEKPEWSEILRFVDDLRNNGRTQLVKTLLSHGVRLDRVSSLRAHFERMRDYRNNAAHMQRPINRRDAAELHHLLFEEGLVRSVIECFPKVKRR